MRPFLARFSEPAWSGHLPSLADFITTTPELKFSVRTRGAQILAIERQDVEGIRLDFVIVLARVQDIEIGNTVNPKDDSFAINELICSTPRATRRVFQTSQT